MVVMKMVVSVEMVGSVPDMKLSVSDTVVNKCDSNGDVCNSEYGGECFRDRA